MSVHYLLDGYNIIHKIPKLAEGSLEEARDGLVKLIEIYRPQGSLKNSITIVFDGRSGVWQDQSSGAVKILFSSDDTADNKIKNIVSNASNAKDYVVVSDDREIKYAVRPMGAKVVSVDDFILKLQKKETGPLKPTKGAQQGTERKKAVSKQDEFKINEELENLWIDKNKKKDTQ